MIKFRSFPNRSEKRERKILNLTENNQRISSLAEEMEFVYNGKHFFIQVVNNEKKTRKINVKNHRTPRT